jgi:uncharacterized membrane protein YbaN (DUF454 family)
MLVAAGLFFVALAIVGLFLPILPTTPFLILAAACFARSSPRFHSWLMNNRLFGAYIRDYREGRAMRPMHKCVSLLLLWSVLGLTGWLAVSSIWVRALLAAVGIGVTVHLLALRNAARRGRQRDR